MTPVERELLAQLKPMRRLAQDLVGSHGVEDLVQDVAVEVLTRPPRPGPLTGWLITVVRHLASKRRRTDRRRLLREQRAARKEALPDASADVESREALQHLTAALFAVPAPYQAVLLLRYVRDL